MPDYPMPPIRYTHAALTHAAGHGGRAGLEALTLDELTELSEGGSRDLTRLIFHTFSYGGYYNMVVSPVDGVMEVDYSDTLEQAVGDTSKGVLLESGPLKGFRALIPERFSTDED